MANISIILVAALAVVAVADPIRSKRSTSNIGVQGAGLAFGTGSASDANQQSIVATGIPGTTGYTIAGGWGSPDQYVPGTPELPAQGSIYSSGTAVVENGVLATQYTDNESNLATANAQTIAANVAYGEDSALVQGSGGQAQATSNGQSSMAGSGGYVAEQSESIQTHA